MRDRHMRPAADTRVPKMALGMVLVQASATGGIFLGSVEAGSKCL